MDFGSVCVPRRHLFEPEEQPGVPKFNKGPGTHLRGVLRANLGPFWLILKQLGLHVVKFVVTLADPNHPKLLLEAIGLTLQN